MVEVMKMDGHTMGENLRKARNTLGLTQAEIARRLEISVTAYQKIESGKTRILNKNYEKCAYELGIPLAELVNGFQPVMGTVKRFEEAMVEYRSMIEDLSGKVASLESSLRDKDMLIHTQELLIEHLQK